MREAGVVELLLTTQSAMWEAAQAAQYSRWLSASEQARLSTMRSPARQQQFIACRYALRLLLARQRAGSVDQWTLDAPDGAAPTVRSHPRNPSTEHARPPYLSLSHSGPYIACAVANHAVGIDVEAAGRRKHRSSVQERANIICSANERQHLLALDSVPAQETYLTQLWCMKESWFKQTGTGVDFAAIRHLECAPEHALSQPGTLRGNVRLWTSPTNKPGAFVLSLCSEVPVEGAALINQTGIRLCDGVGNRLLER
ncbi:4'-phosphopantetheinyl transferase superfamily protein [Diaphorobacter sp.]|uniref:4'-phosphopantetheinyl transferase family protein n=1 Tax=Diaphorobacter sp. TaxID=1934310 RepID=UPI0028AD63E4|nr:4'-phosphopantetheinyl transferase superfamily protein [Diaphorobacter sp.]